MNIAFKIIRFENQTLQNKPVKVVGFNVLDDDNPSSCVYHETLLSTDEINEKTPEQCVDLAFSKLSSSIAETVQTLKSVDKNLLGAYYIPN